jgi:hypothetical protein
MVSTRSAKKAKTEKAADGSIADGGEVVGLPESIYWDYVRPFTPVKDRVIVSKRCTTRYYAGERVELDETYLKEFECCVKVTDADGRWVDGETAVMYKNIPIARGEPGTPRFHIEFNNSQEEHSASDPDVALEKLRSARNAWDVHLSKIPSPSARLHACLKILHTDEHDGACPFLFVGKGEIGDVVKFHASVNLSSLNGPWHGRNSFPNTQLGYWVARYLSDVMRGDCDGASYISTWKFKEIVSKLIDAGADVSPFFEPLAEFPSQFSALSVLGGGELLVVYKRGMSMHEIMTMHAESYRRREERAVFPWHQLSGQPGRTIGNLLDSLGKKSNITFRFIEGDRVECNMGEEGWMAGTIKKQWYYGFPYEIDVDNSMARRSGLPSIAMSIFGH